MSYNISNPVQFAIRKTMDRIPVTLLDLTFKTYRSKALFGTQQPIYKGLEQDIETFIIKQRVAPDLNLVAGKMKECVLLSTLIENTMVRDSDYHLRRAVNTIYRIPPEERENRDIIKVIKLRHQGVGGLDTPFNIMSDTSSLKDNMRNMLGAQSFNDTYTPPPVKLLAPDLIQIEAPVVNHIYWVLSFMIAYPEDFRNITDSSYTYFADCVTYATQWFIFNQMVIDIDAAATRGGITIGALRDQLYKYEDSETKYKEALSAFTATERFDPRVQQELMRLCL